MKKIPVYTIYASKKNPTGSDTSWNPGVKDTLLSWATAKEAADAMFAQADDLESLGSIHILWHDKNEPDEKFRAAVCFEWHGNMFQRWVVQEFIVLPDNAAIVNILKI